MSEAQSRLACQIYALDAAQRAKRNELFATIQGVVAEIRELPDGIAVKLPPSAKMWMTTAEFVTLERRCCPFFNFGLESEGESGPLWLRLTGPEGVKEFIAAEMGLDASKFPPLTK